MALRTLTNGSLGGAPRKGSQRKPIATAWGLIALLLIATALGTTGCGGAAAGGTAAIVETSAVDTQPVKQGGTLDVAAAQGVPTLDPYKVIFSFQLTTWPLLWSTLTKYTSTSGNEVVPDLALSWKSADDFKTWRFKLRAGLKFSDGEPLTAKDVASSLERAFDPKTAFVIASFIPKPTAITAPDSSTVEIKLSESFFSLPALMPLVPIEDVENVKEIDTSPIVTGPYTVAKFQPEQILELVPNPDYYGPKPKLDRLVISKAADSTSALTSLLAGDVQALWNVPWTDVRQLEGNSEVKVSTAGQPSQNVILEMDDQAGVFKNPKARQALAYAINREAVLNAVYGGHGLVPTDNNPIPAWSDVRDKDLASYPFDLEKAKKLFAEAGVGPGTTLTYWTIAGAYPEFTSMGEILQADLKKIGINLVIKSVEINQWATKIEPVPQRFPNLIVPNGHTGLPIPANLIFLKSGTCECSVDNATFDKALEILHEEVPVINVVQDSWPVAYRSNVANVWVDPINTVRFDTAGIAK
jgi:peptide/nickel transport system substrate-binding protein